MTRLIVKPHNPRGRGLLVAAVVVAFAATVAAAYFVGEWRGGYERLASRAQIARLTKQRDALARKSADLHQQTVFLTRSRDIDRTAQQHVQKTNAALQAQVAGLRKQLSFYHDIIAPGDATRAGVRVQALKLVADGSPRRYHYSMVLMQAPRHNRTTAGTVKMTVIGKRDETPLKLDLSALGSGTSDIRSFKFRYFENLQGDLELPAGFSPERVEITVTQNGRHTDPFTRSFDWRVTG